MQDEETDTEEDEEDETDVSLIAFPGDSLLKSNYREMTTHLKSSRLDAVVSSGLGLPRKYVTMLSTCVASVACETSTACSTLHNIPCFTICRARLDNRCKVRLC